VTEAATEVARSYYDSEDADRFYAKVWGGEDIHVGLYASDDEPIFDASQRTVERMAEIAGVREGQRVLDLGSGYGGAARYLAERRGARVDALNLSRVENERHRALNRERGLEERVVVHDGAFEELPFDDARFDVVWSQDAILHSGDRPRVLSEAARVLKPGGALVFTDPMMSDGCPEGVLQPILERIHLSSLGSPGFYERQAKEHGLTLVRFEELREQLVRHYTRVLEETTRLEPKLRGAISDGYLARMKRGLGYWIEGGNAGHLTWGIFHFRK
jgi:sarcosine/dimethylglycine N-methyltransferase